MRSSALRLIAVTLAALSVTAPLRAQGKQGGVDAATAATVRRLLELTGTAQLALRGIESMVPMQRAANPQIPAAFWDALVARARRDLPQYIDSLIPIYASHLTRAELEQLVRFYESPVGRRLAEVTPLISQESMQLGQRWGAAMGREVGDSLARAGVKPANPR